MSTEIVQRAKPFEMYSNATAFLNFNKGVLNFKEMKLLTDSDREQILQKFITFFSLIAQLTTVEQVYNFPPETDEELHQVMMTSSGSGVSGAITVVRFDNWLQETIYIPHKLDKCLHEKGQLGNMYETKTKLRALFVSIMIQRILTIRLAAELTTTFTSNDSHSTTSSSQTSRLELIDIWNRYSKFPEFTNKQKSNSKRSKVNATDDHTEQQEGEQEGDDNHTDDQSSQHSSSHSLVPSNFESLDVDTQSKLINFYMALKEAKIWRPRSDSYQKKFLPWEKFAMRVCSLAVNEGVWYCPGSGQTDATKLRWNVFNAYVHVVVLPEQAAVKTVMDVVNNTKVRRKRQASTEATDTTQATATKTPKIRTKKDETTSQTVVPEPPTNPPAAIAPPFVLPANALPAGGFMVYYPAGVPINPMPTPAGIPQPYSWYAAPQQFNGVSANVNISHNDANPVANPVPPVMIGHPLSFSPDVLIQYYRNLAATLQAQLTTTIPASIGKEVAENATSKINSSQSSSNDHNDKDKNDKDGDPTSWCNPVVDSQAGQSKQQDTTEHPSAEDVVEKLTTLPPTIHPLITSPATKSQLHAYE